MSGYKLISGMPEQQMYFGSFDTNGTSAPDGLRGSHFTVTRTGVGVFRVTFTNPPSIFVQFDSYDADIHGTGVEDMHAKVTAEDNDATAGAYIDITVYQLSDNAGDVLGTATETTNKKICFWVAARVGASGVDAS